MTSRGETPPAVQARVVLEPLKTQKSDGRSHEQKIGRGRKTRKRKKRKKREKK
jgi:hypothetical protein